ncbi:MAG: hypothetical protein AB1452_06365 [Pseudomonadota bacterium]
MAEYKSALKSTLEAREARSQRLQEILRTPDDVVGLVLRGHLFIEELLFAAVEAHCKDAEHLKAARLRFPQLVALLRALEKISSVPPNYWTALSELNALRNALAHKLEPNDLASRVARFVGAVAANPDGTQIAGPHTSREALESALLRLIGGLEVVAVWQVALEELVGAQAAGRPQ